MRWDGNGEASAPSLWQPNFLGSLGSGGSGGLCGSFLPLQQAALYEYASALAALGSPSLVKPYPLLATPALPAGLLHPPLSYGHAGQLGLELLSLGHAMDRSSLPGHHLHHQLHHHLPSLVPPSTSEASELEESSSSLYSGATRNSPV